MAPAKRKTYPAATLPLSRRALLLLCAALAAAPATRALPPRRLVFPRDYGSHPELRTEWWYVTGHGSTAGGREFGYQVTFFRSRVDATQKMRSRFAARQLIFAHAALTDLQGRVLHHGQRIARAGFAIAQASERDCDVRLRDWSLTRAREGGGNYDANVSAGEFALSLRFAPTQPLLLQGDGGLSRKGPSPEHASYYYSQPQLAVRGHVVLRGRRFDLAGGSAWMDHEWSEAYLHPDASGWDWIGMNLDDGSALMAFRIRPKKVGDAPIWAGGAWRPRGGESRSFAPGEVQFEAQQHWTSPRSRAHYPTRWRVHTPAGTFEVRALLDDQELDSRGSTGAIYWEGLAELLDAEGRRVGRGYLEMTGYAAALRL